MPPLNLSIGALLRTSVFWLVLPTVITRGADNLTVVHLADGRVLQGILDTRTDETFLWLRTVTDNFSLSSRFRWSDVLDVDPSIPDLPGDEHRIEVDVSKGIDVVDQFEPAADEEEDAVDGKDDWMDWPTSRPGISEAGPWEAPLLFPVARALRIEAHLAKLGRRRRARRPAGVSFAGGRVRTSRASVWFDRF